MDSYSTLKELIDRELNDPSSVKQMYKVNLISNDEVVETKTFDTFGEAYHCAFEYFNNHIITINDVPFTEDDYEAYLEFLLLGQL
mgnify:CR=1 FL=1